MRPDISGRSLAAALPVRSANAQVQTQAREQARARPPQDAGTQGGTEPDAELAPLWWPDPVAQYAGMGIQLDRSPWGGWFSSDPFSNTMYPGHFYVYRSDVGLCSHGEQHWADNPTPVLETDWPQSNSVVYRQSTFAHVKGVAIS